MASLRRVRGFDLAEIGQAAARILRPQRDSGGLGERDLRRTRTELEACLDARLGGVTIRSRAAAIAARYAVLDPSGRRRFFDLLASEYGVDRVRLAVALAAMSTAGPGGAAPSAASDANLRRRLRTALEPRWERLFELFCALPGGVKFTVDLRADLLDYLAAEPSPTAPTAGEPVARPEQLQELDDDLRTVLSRLFPPGLLELRRITWDTPASLLEKLIEYEAVHEITSWDDLRNRLDHDRRCYAFVHPGMPAEPLIFVEVALLRGMAGHIAPLLDVSAPLGDVDDADTAIFYSISACQPGLAGVNLGDVLIKDVVTDLRTQLPGLETFATLSPIPGFRRWFDRQAAVAAGSAGSTGPSGSTGSAPSPPSAEGPPLVTGDEARALLAFAERGELPVATLRRLLATEGWHGDPGIAAALRAPLLRACAHYLVVAIRRGRAIDRVANFHLTNGARVERLNWLANTSPAGLESSYGMMVNYRYELDRIDANHEAYLGEGRIARSSAVGRLLS